jgi:hypothetical protein
MINNRFFVTVPRVFQIAHTGTPIQMKKTEFTYSLLLAKNTQWLKLIATISSEVFAAWLGGITHA